MAPTHINLTPCPAVVWAYFAYMAVESECWIECLHLLPTAALACTCLLYPARGTPIAALAHPLSLCPLPLASTITLSTTLSLGLFILPAGMPGSQFYDRCGLHVLQSPPTACSAPHIHPPSAQTPFQPSERGSCPLTSILKCPSCLQDAAHVHRQEALQDGAGQSEWLDLHIGPSQDIQRELGFAARATDHPPVFV